MADRPPHKQGLYDPANERDSCGMGFIAHVGGRGSNAIIAQALEILANLDHRGGVGADPQMGDGAGCLIRIPDALFRDWARRERLNLPPAGEYAVAMCFLPGDEASRDAAVGRLERFVTIEGQRLVGWRDVPVDPAGIAPSVLATIPVIRQAIVARGPNVADQDAFERKLLAIRKQTLNPLEAEARRRDLPGLADFYIASFSTRTLVYKGMLLAGQVGSFYADLRDPLTTSALAMVHQRFSTNTFPSWRLAHPYRFIAHNGEINTVRGNVNWMNARRRTMESPLIGADLDKMWPIIPHGQSDTACLDNALELLLAGGYSLAHAMMLLIPEAWSDTRMEPARRAFYEYHAALMEPWDGPAAIAFTDGRQIGATLDRNGLRPARFLVTDDDLVVMASESGVLPIPEEKIVRKWRLQPGRMLLIDLEQGRIVEDEELKASLAAAAPYADWLRGTQFNLKDLPPGTEAVKRTDPLALARLQGIFGYTDEDLKFFLAPMAGGGDDPIGSMGTDTPPAVLSQRPRLLYDYFKQSFAQVTNPPIDPIRESLVMSLVSMIGPRPNLLGHHAGTHKRLEVSQPILTNEDLEKIRSIHETLDGAFRTTTLDATWPKGGDAQALEAALQRLCWEATEAVLADINVLILSDRAAGAARIPIPAALATGAVHHHLIRQGLRMQTGLVLETGEAREVHHFCVLGGYGAEAINPWLAFDTLAALTGEPAALANYIKAVGKGILKVMSKMGISTWQSYCGAQIFDAVGLGSCLVGKYFDGTATPVEGIGLPELAAETARRHACAFAEEQPALEMGGLYGQRIGGEAHAWTFDTIADLQHAVRGRLPEKYRAFADGLNDRAREQLTLRGLMRLRPARPALPLDEVEPASEIVRRFSTGAMSFGSISREAHATLAVAMNRIGGRSNTGEGGEETDRFRPIPKPPLPSGDAQVSRAPRGSALSGGQGDQCMDGVRRFGLGEDAQTADTSSTREMIPNPERSAIKQVASGRFGVTTEYLVNADELQIKIAQGAKPGEGGQLPGDKVDAHIAAVRHSTPGVGLISPPPHHDIYSIEDLAQLIHDLRSVNPGARISVKLVSAVGVGTVAAGVAKAGADHVTIAGYEGGTGASPLTSLTHAGLPWEIGLAETQQTLILNGLRGRICVQVDGGLRTGRDVAIAAMLGADEFGFATAPLIAAGCIMMRKCHLNTCPVGIATQDPVLRARFTGQPEHVIDYFFFVAEELREIMAGLGIRSVDELVGRSDLLQMDPSFLPELARGGGPSEGWGRGNPPAGPVAHSNHWKAGGLDFTRLLHQPPGEALRRHVAPLCRVPGTPIDRQLIEALDGPLPVRIERRVRNVDRAVGAMVSGEIARRHDHAGLDEGSLHAVLDGSAGQSFGTFLARGVTLELTGDANDYVGKGLSGGRIVVRQPSEAPRRADANIIVGNTCLYGAIEGELFANGIAGERFAVRNSGAVAVVEGTGDHGCEYMTGGLVVVLGAVGRNFAAGMSGGIAYLWDPEYRLSAQANLASVELEPLDGDDAATVRDLVERHQRLTGSTRAAELLADWPAALAAFVRVMPVEYRLALARHAKVAAA